MQAGDKVPADGHLVFGEVFAIQASLTGENDALKKSVPPKGYQPANDADFHDPYLLFRYVL